MNRFLKEESGVLTFEWILLITVLVIGIVGGLSAVRDAMICELADVTGAMMALDQSYMISWPWEVNTPDGVIDGAAGSAFRDVNGKYIQGRKSGMASMDAGAGPGENDGTIGFPWP